MNIFFAAHAVQKELHEYDADLDIDRDEQTGKFTVRGIDVTDYVVAVASDGPGAFPLDIETDLVSEYLAGIQCDDCRTFPDELENAYTDDGYTNGDKVCDACAEQRSDDLYIQRYGYASFVGVSSKDFY